MDEIRENKEEGLIRDAFNSIMDCDETKALGVLKKAEYSGTDLVELLTHGYSAGMDQLADSFVRGEVLLPKLICATNILRTVMLEFERKMAIAEIKCAGVDYCFFRTITRV